MGRLLARKLRSRVREFSFDFQVLYTIFDILRDEVEHGQYPLQGNKRQSDS
jgi:hypothetical protein